MKKKDNAQGEEAEHDLQVAGYAMVSVAPTYHC